MEFVDPNPYARNLIVLSLLFIFYSFLGLEPKDPTTFSIFYNEFDVSNDISLLLTPWIFLFWFVFRYWQESERSALMRLIGRVRVLRLTNKDMRNLRELSHEHFERKGRSTVIDMRPEFGATNQLAIGDNLSVSWFHCFYLAEYFVVATNLQTRGDNSEVVCFRPVFFIFRCFFKNCIDYFFIDNVFMRVHLPYCLFFVAVFCGFSEIRCNEHVSDYLGYLSSSCSIEE